jgi:hypothetical protein
VKVEHYLERLIGRLQEVSADGRCPPAEAFVYVVRKLRMWFEHKRLVVGPEERGRDGGFLDEHARAYIKDAENEHHDMAREGISSQHASPANPTAPSMQPIPFQPSQPQSQSQSQSQSQAAIIGTSSMPASQLNPSANFMFPATQSQSQRPMTSSQFPGMSDLNAAYNAANYNINWDDLNFSQQEMTVFDDFMAEPNWMGYLI